MIQLTLYSNDCNSYHGVYFSSKPLYHNILMVPQLSRTLLRLSALTVYQTGNVTINPGFPNKIFSLSLGSIVSRLRHFFMSLESSLVVFIVSFKNHSALIMSPTSKFKA